MTVTSNPFASSEVEKRGSERVDTRFSTSLETNEVRGTLTADAPLAPLVWFKAGGLAEWLFEPKDADDLATFTAAKIAEKAPLAVMAIKESVNRSYETTLAEGVRFERRVFHSLFATEDRAEGMEAFVDKRTPKFRGT